MKKLYTILLAVLLAAMLGVGIWSLADTDPTGSVSEKRTFQKPQFSVQALLDGTYIPALETYYSDTFPGRETLLEVNRTLNRFYYYSGSGESGVLLVNLHARAMEPKGDVTLVKGLKPPECFIIALQNTYQQSEFSGIN